MVDYTLGTINKLCGELILKISASFCFRNYMVNCKSYCQKTI